MKISLYPDLWYLHDGLAFLLNFADDFRGAVIEYRKAEGLKPDLDSNWHWQFGGALERAGDIDDAVYEYHRAVQGMRRSECELMCGPYYQSLASALQMKGDPEGAAGVYRDGLRQIDAPVFHVGLARLMAQKGDLDGAIGEYRAALRRHPTDKQAHFELARVLEKQGHIPAALDEFRAAYLIDPQDQTATVLATVATPHQPTHGASD